ncbi:MAG: hypothetical protein EAZ07_05730 [Cytophagales bacterium]|nr:MAG: hypothetical protein EAZ07_05730 [Cytophagales bacterium]
MSLETNKYERQIEEFKNKFYVSLLFKGALITLGIALSVFLVLSLAEFWGRFNSSIRFIFLLIIIGVFVYLFIRYLMNPILSFLGIKAKINNSQVAQKVGNHFPQISDKLLNIIQLEKEVALNNPLAKAAYLQKQIEFSSYDFNQAVDDSNKRKYLILLGVPLIIFLIIFLKTPQLITDASKRIYYFNEKFAEENPFKFQLIDFKNYALRGENVKIRFQPLGINIPKSLSLISGSSNFPMTKNNKGEFEYTIKNIQSNLKLKFEIGKFETNEFEISIIENPFLKTLNANINYPKYLKRKPEQISNAGNIIIPEGSTINWLAETNKTDLLSITFDNQKHPVNEDDNKYNFSKTITKSQAYAFRIRNKIFNQISDSISYQITCIKDAFPSIKVNPISDSLNYSKIDIVGDINDDYGIQALYLNYYKTDKTGRNTTKNKINIPLNSKENQQKFYFSWVIDSIISNDEGINYELEVYDNDGINGSKSTKSTLYNFSKPSIEKIQEQINNQTKENIQTTENIKSSSEETKNKISELEEKLKSKSNLNWQDKKELQSLIKENKNKNEKVESLRENLQELENKKKNLDNSNNEELDEKIKNLNELLENIVDEETKKLYDKLNELLNEQMNKNEIDKTIKQLALKEENFNNEINKLLEMFKEIQIEEKINSTVSDIKSLAEKQEKEAEKNLANKNENSKEKNIEEQKSLNKEFEKIKDELSEINKLNNDLENKLPLDLKEEAQKNISENQQKAKEALEDNKSKKAGESGKKAAESMKDLAQEMESAQAQSEQNEQEENIKDLRMILENLIQLSFDQEEIIKGFKKTSNIDPQYIQLSQKQIKIKNDSKVIKDSLLALSKRIFQIKSFVTRELTLMNAKIDESIEAIKARRTDQTLTKQQYAMASMNNLALMLDDVLDQMQSQMNQANKPGSKSCKKPGKKPGKMPGLSELQKQIGQQMQQLMKSGNTPSKEMSEALAKMAAQQEYIRKTLEKLNKEKKGGKNPGGLDGLIKEMEKNEEDLVNKRINQQQINRQQEILTRLLESEKAEKERDLEETRTAEKASQELNKNIPKSIEEFLKKRENNTELLKTISPVLNEFYKKESNLYFEQLSN